MPAADRGRGVEPWKTLLGSALLLALSRHDVPQRELEAPPATSPSPHAPEGSAVHPPPAPAPPEDVLWAGCTEVRLSTAGEAEECTLYSDDTVEKATLRVWLPSRVREPAVQFDGKVAASVDTAEVDGGTSLLVQPGHGGRLTVTGRVGRARVELLSLDVDFRPRPDGELRGRLDGIGDDREAQRALAQELREQLEGEVSAPQRLQLTRYLQFVHYDMGEYRQAVEHARDAARLAADQDEPLAACSSLWSAGFMLGDLGDPEAGLELLRTGCDHRARLPIVEMKSLYYGGLLELSLGRIAHARRSIERSSQIARRLRWQRWEMFAANLLIETLAKQGRFGWARQILQRAQELQDGSYSSELERCRASALYHHKLGDLAHREAELVGGDLDLALEHWREALAIYRDRTRCPDHVSVHAQASTIELALARAAIEAGELARARTFLTTIPHEVGPVIEWRRRLLQAELALARGELSTAKRILEDLATDRGSLTLGPEEEWSHHLTLARLHQRRGEGRAALEALAQAQARLDLDRASQAVETDRHAAMRRKSSELQVRLLLERGLLRSALCAARVARARGLVALGPIPSRALGPMDALEESRTELFEGYQWYDPRDIPIDERMKLEGERRDLEATLSARSPPVECDELPTPQPGEASLLFFHDGRGSIGFGWDAEGRLVVRRLSPWPASPSPETLGHLLLDPFTAVLEGATRVRVLASGAMHDVSFADLSWRGRALGDERAVVHGLDLPIVPLHSREPFAALVFSDPERRLMDSYPELGERFERWREHLEAHELRVTAKAPSSNSLGHVTVAETLERTRGAELALLYGFGAIMPSYYDMLPAGGRQHEPDQIGFGAGADVLTRLDVLLEAGMVPRHVILAHCDSAAVDVHGVSGAIGLAQSYVQAGAEWAVGAVGDVAPESMAVTVDALIEGLPPGASADEVAVALRAAKRRLHAQGLPDADQLRLWAP